MLATPLCLGARLSFAFASVLFVPASAQTPPGQSTPYKLTMTGGSPAQSTVIREGKPLSAEQREGVQAAIDMIKQLETSCGLGPVDGPEGQSNPPKKLSEKLQKLLDDGELNQETAADPKDVGGSTANDHTGNGTDQNGNTYSTEGKGVNVGDSQIPKETASGSFTSGGKRFDKKAVANLVRILVHESSHLTDPNNGANTACEYEEAARLYALSELCKVASCTALQDQYVKKAACEAMQVENSMLCACCQPQAACAACDNFSIQVVVACPCPPPGSGGGGSGGGGGSPQQLQLVPMPTYVARLQSLGTPAPTPYIEAQSSEILAVGNLHGTIRLDLTDETLYFDAESEAVDFHAAYSFGADVNLHFAPLTFTQSARGVVTLAGFDTNTGAGMIVALPFSPSTGTVGPADPYFSSSNLKVPQSICTVPSVPQFVILDQRSHAALLFDVRTSALVKLGSPSDNPKFEFVQHVHAAPIRENGTSYGLQLWFTTSPYALSGSILDDTGIVMYDVDSDGAFDIVY